MPKFTENIIEQAALEWFDELGYTILHAPDIAPEEPNAERQNYADVVLTARKANCFGNNQPRYTI